MIEQSGSSPVAVLYSGGLDSSILLARLLAEGHAVRPLAVDCQWRWQAAERHAAERFLAAMARDRLAELVVLEMPLADLYPQHWSFTGQGVPAADAPDPEVYLPGHNPLLLVKAHVWCHLNGVEQLALGTLRGNPFADATTEFLREFSAAMDRATSGHVRLVRPLAHLGKREVMQLGRDLPLELTFSCLAPVADRHCGACNKCGERQRAFLEAGLADRTVYAAAEKTSTI